MEKPKVTFKDDTNVMAMVGTVMMALRDAGRDNDASEYCRRVTADGFATLPQVTNEYVEVME
jgi:hypothetical protein